MEIRLVAGDTREVAERRWVRACVIALAGVAFGMTAAAWVHDSGPTAPTRAPQVAALVTRRIVEPDVHWLEVRRGEDDNKPGSARSVMGQLVLEQEPLTSGPSPDSLRFRFDAPVEVSGIVISVDIGGPALVEVVAGINTNVPYGIEEDGDDRHQPFTARDWLLHTSDQTVGASRRLTNR